MGNVAATTRPRRHRRRDQRLRMVPGARPILVIHHSILHLQAATHDAQERPYDSFMGRLARSAGKSWQERGCAPRLGLTAIRRPAIRRYDRAESISGND